MERANGFADYIKRKSIHSTAIVSHGNFIRALTGIKPKNCEIVEFVHRYFMFTALFDLLQLKFPERYLFEASIILTGIYY